MACLNIIQSVVHRFQKTAETEWIDNHTDVWMVKNPTSEAISRLKRKKFQYHNRGYWYLPKSHITEAEFKKLRALSEKAEQGAGQKEKDLEEKARKRDLEIRTLFNEASQRNYVGFEILRNPHLPELKIQGDTYPIRQLARDAGGEWDQGAWYFNINRTKIPEFKKLIDEIKDISDKMKNLMSDFDDLLRERKYWYGLRVGMQFTGNEVLVHGDTQAIKEHLHGFKAKGSDWVIDIREYNPADCKKLIELLDTLDQKAKEEKEEKRKLEPPRPVSTPRDERENVIKKPNKQPGNCYFCKGLVKTGEGWLIVFQKAFDERDYWSPVHKDPKVCEKIKEENKLKKDLLQSQGKMFTDLMDLSMSKGVAPKVEKPIVPPGELIMLSGRNVAHGRGYWVVIEPDKRHYWWVQNNGADGDDWGQNNIRTEGAGAIGWRVEMTPEAKILIEGLSGKSIDS